MVCNKEPEPSNTKLDGCTPIEKEVLNMDDSLKEIKYTLLTKSEDLLNEERNQKKKNLDCISRVS